MTLTLESCLLKLKNNDLQLCQLRLYPQSAWNEEFHRRIFGRGNRPRKLSCEIQHGVLKKVTSHENTAFETVGKLYSRSIITFRVEKFM